MSIRVFTLLALTGMASGCLGSALDGGGGGGGGSGGGGDVDMAPDVVSQFYATVQPILQQACGGCHGVTGTAAPAFMLSTPDMLSNLLAYPGIIGSSPEKSRLYAKGIHEGPAFTPDEAPVVGDWITFYNANRPMNDGGEAKPTIAPFVPSLTASNSMDLGALDPALTGVKVTFDAKMVGTSIQLSNLKVVAPATTGVHLVHPVFVVWDQNLDPIPDPVDSFSNLDQTVFSGTATAMGPGTLVLPNFATGDLLNVIFTTAEPKMGSADAGTITGCKALAMFTANVKPLLASGGCSTNCHVGATPQSMLNFATTPDAALCVLVLSEVDKTTPANSQMLLQPDPAKANGHPQKVNPFTNFQTAVTNWINAEK